MLLTTNILDFVESNVYSSRTVFSHQIIRDPL